MPATETSNIEMIPAGTIPAVAAPAAPASALVGVYKPAAPVFVAGEGCELIAEDGTRYLDFTSGIAVNALGYGDPDVAAAIRGALDAGVLHTSNLFRTQPAAELAGWLAENSFADRVFFCNSGAEANEGAIKFARRWAGAEKTEIIAFRGGFHGRTMGALAATDRAAYQDPFRPLMPGAARRRPGAAPPWGTGPGRGSRPRTRSTRDRPQGAAGHGWPMAGPRPCGGRTGRPSAGLPYSARRKSR